ncbi:MAG: hypothetical protein LBJ47_04925 [Tannerella sp.]|nr:hypothetical protein [Tannerella sp.]
MVSWQFRHAGFSLQAVIPAGSNATVYIPCSPDAGITESGTPLPAGTGEAGDLTDKGWKDGYRILDVASGTWRFDAR